MMGWSRSAFNDRILVNTPEVAEPASDEDREALDKGRRTVEAGDVVSKDELRVELEM